MTRGGPSISTPPPNRANVWPWFVEERQADLSTTDTPK